MNIHLLYEPEKTARDVESLYEDIQSRKTSCRKCQSHPRKSYIAIDIFLIDRSKDGKLSFRRNPVAIEKELSCCGSFLSNI